MKNKLKITKLAITVMIFIAALLIILTNNIDQKVKPIAKDGILDLRGWDFKANGIIELNGKWDFYYNELLTPADFIRNNSMLKTGFSDIPGNFKGYLVNGKPLGGFGYATYHLKVLTNNQQDLYGIKTEFIQTAHKIWANGKIVSECGVVGKSLKAMKGEIVPKTGSFYNANGEIDLVLQVSNYYSRAAQIDTILLGTDSQINDYRAKNIGFDLFLLGCALVGGIYHLVIFLRRKNDKAPLYFSIVCFLMAFRTSLVGERLIHSVIPNINYTLNGKLLMWTFFIYIPILVLYIDNFYKNTLSKTIVKLSNYIGIAYFIIILFLPEKYYNHIVLPVEVVVGLLLIYILIKLFIGYFMFDDDYLIPSISILALVVTRLNDILYEYSIIQTGSYAPVGILIFILAQSYVLADRFSKAYGEIEIMTEKLKGLDRLKDDFLTNTSHELKTPLKGIIGLLESIMAGTNINLNKEQKETMEIVQVTAERLSNLVNDISDFSKLKNNHINIELKPVNIRQEVKIVIKSIENIIVKKNISIINNINKDISYALADENRTQQILYNLIGNAVKFTDCGVIVISAIERDDFIEISVSDTGIGISEEQLENIFTAYEKGEFAEGLRDGTGLGLHITKKLVQLLGGEISVESILGKGSKFIFTLPKDKDYNVTNEEEDDVDGDELDNENDTKDKSVLEQVTTETLDDTEEDTNKQNTLAQNINILVVDDEAINIRIIRHFLNYEKYNVITAANGKEAIEIVNNNEDLDLIILDMMLPDMLGYEICAILREKYTLFELPILMMTGDNRAESLVVSLECGANDYTNKPFDRSELLARAKTLISLKQAVKQALDLQKEVTNSSVVVAALSENVEENVKKLSELQEYDKLKTEFFANISHELRTPLNVIWGTIQLLELLNTGNAYDEESIKKHLKVMSQNTLRLVRLINNIIDTTKIDGGYLSLQLSNKDVVYIVEEITLSTAKYIESLGKTLVFDTDVEEKMMAIDEEKLERIILNILSNAIKFTAPGDSIFVNLHDLGDRIKLTIKDTGIGMPEDKLENIFERFVQVDKSFTRNNEGSGIGLSLVKALIEMHGGTVYATSKLGEGSEFIIEFPVTLVEENENDNAHNEKLDVESKYVERIQIEFSDIYS